MVYLPNTRVRRWLVVVFAVVVLLLTIQFHQFSRDESSGISQWQDWISSPADHAISPAHPDHDIQAVLPTSKGRVLVTGGSGMIGKRVVRRLLRANVAVTVLDTIVYDDEIEAIKHDYPQSDLKVVVGDIRNLQNLGSAMRDAKGVIHLAAVSRVLWCLENQEDCTDVNVRGTQLVIEALKGGWLIQASSREVYGNLDHIPVEESAPRKPANVYGKSKAAAEDVITNHINKVTNGGNRRLNAIILRLSNVYGSAKDHPERLIPAIMRNAISNRPIQMVGGDQDLDMVFVEDVVDAISLAVKRLDTKANAWNPPRGEVEVFNVGTSQSTSAMTLIRKTLWLTNSSSPLRIIPADHRFPSRYLGSTLYANDVLGYKARVSIDEGLRRLGTELLEDTLAFLQKTRASEPFSCDTPKHFELKDLLALNDCAGILSRAQDATGIVAYANFIPRDKNGEWNDTTVFEWKLDPSVFNFSIAPSDYDDQTAKFSLRIMSKQGENAEVNISPEVKETEFLARLHPTTGYLNLRHIDGSPLPRMLQKRQVPNADDLDELAAEYNEEHAQLFDYDYRIVPTCCPGKPAPWPLFREDSIASNILDTRKGKFESFNASQIVTTCQRMKDAARHAEVRLENFKLLKDTPLEEAQLPTGRAADWRLRRYSDICSTLCGHPTFCLDTGDCTCGHSAACVPRKRFPFSDFANMPILSYPPVKPTDQGDKALVERVKRSLWTNNLGPDARRYFASSPQWPALTTVRDPDDLEKIKVENATKFFSLHNSWMGCFSADTVMERASKMISKPYSDNSLVFLPFYSVNDFIRYPNPVEYIDNTQKQLQKEVDPADMSMTFTHDFGRCNGGQLAIYHLRRGYQEPQEKHKRISSWAPMGDLNSPCYFPDQDVVIPARTCLQDKLRETFSDIAKVKPIRQRSVLATFKGRTTGIYGGSVVRQKLTCDRPMSPGRLTGGEKLERWWQQLRPNSDYLTTINETVFCPLPRGTTGWATRTTDVIYGGCIPVLIGDQTHHVFWDVLDWSKFAIFIDEWDIERFEEILLGYTWEELEQKQANLMLVRDAFLYPSEDNMDAAIEERTPFWYATHQTWLLQQTKFPV